VIPFLLLLADLPNAAPAPAAPATAGLSPAETRYDQCVRHIKDNPEKAAAEADAWRVAGGGLHARQCLGLAYVALERWSAAVIAFEQAAREAQSQSDGRAAMLWSQAGNAALAGDSAAQARDDLSAALALPSMSDPMRGEAYLDRARAWVALNDMNSARTDINAALKLVPGDGLAWLLSATLARRQNDAVRAQADIEEAVRLASDDASVALEAGNIAAMQGADEAARIAWQRAADADPKGPVGDSARMALAKLPPRAAVPPSPAAVSPSAPKLDYAPLETGR
jgi:tetratricopeptide (TPR) repeat protein